MLAKPRVELTGQDALAEARLRWGEAGWARTIEVRGGGDAKDWTTLYQVGVHGVVLGEGLSWADAIASIKAKR